MEILYLLIPISLVLVGVIVWALLWAVRSGQFEDLDGPAYRILMEDEAAQHSQDEHRLGEGPDHR